MPKISPQMLEKRKLRRYSTEEENDFENEIIMSKVSKVKESEIKKEIIMHDLEKIDPVEKLFYEKN